uniref:Enoyl-CoA hydratase n=1 Tax=Gossypium raimondii TaxID=29730 RepID=A0A0D2TBA1_GOSRA|nr:hypothetical protein B456_008G232000 [Gossypium raimondii]
MAALTVLTKSLGYHCAKRCKISTFSQNFPSHNSRFQTLRTLILEPSLSESVKLNRLSDYDSAERKKMTAAEVHSFVNYLQSTFSLIEELQIPTIAVIEGAALGGGLEMALSCDLRICGETALLSLPETGLAIIPGSLAPIFNSAAKDIIFTGRRMGGRDAMSMGLVNYCVPAGEAHPKALEIAREINQKGPIAIRMAKRAINEGIDREMVSALDLEEECYEQTLNTKDRLEGLAAFAEKRKPIYTGE